MDGLGEAVAVGTAASAALVAGALIGVRFQVPKGLLAMALAFAAGALITALAFELFEEPRERGGRGRAAIGLMAGAAVFTLLDWWLDRAARSGDKEEAGSDKLDLDAAASDRAPTAASAHGAAGGALLAAVVLDGTPENIALGVSLEGAGAGFALLAAIVVSNFPEAMVGAASMKAQGTSTARVLGLWTAGAVVLVAAVVLGAGPLAGAPSDAISLPLAFAAGAVLASLADTLMPEAYRDGGPAVALSTAAGFLLSYSLALV